MKRTTSTLLLTLCFATAGSGAVVEAIVARVGDRIITRTQYASRLKNGLEEIGQNSPATEVEERKRAFREGLLDELLSELLLKDRADRLAISVSDAEVQEAIKRLKAQYGIESDESFQESLAKSGLTRPEMEARLRDTILTNKVFGRELRSREDLTDRELRERYEREKERYRLPERARVREIVVMMANPDDAESRGRARSRADEAFTRAQKGEDFTALVPEFSDAPTKSKGGELGEISKGELLPVLDSGVFKSDAGAVVGPIETRFGFHLLRVDQRIPSEVPSFETIKERLRKEADDETFQRDYKSYIERLRKEAFIKIYEENVPAV